MLPFYLDSVQWDGVLWSRERDAGQV